MNITGEQVRDAYAQAPEEVRRTFASDETTNTIIAIQKRYQLHVDVSGVLGKQVGWLLLGLMSPMEFLGGLVDAGVSGDVAKAIVTDINEQIFAPLRARMQGAGGSMPAPTPVPPTPTPQPQAAPQPLPEPVWPQPSSAPAPEPTPQPAWTPAATVHVYVPPQQSVSPVTQPIITTATPTPVVPPTPAPAPVYAAPAPSASPVPPVMPTIPERPVPPPPPNLPGVLPESSTPIQHANDPYREPI